MSDTTARYDLPLIAPGQAQKELPHNEALAALDLTVQAQVESVRLTTPPVAPLPGQCWIVGAAPTGAWTGQAQALAGWTSGGWRFVAPREGMSAWLGGDAGSVRYVDGEWTNGELRGLTLMLAGQPVVGARRPAIADPAGGGTVDQECRVAVRAILAALRGHGLIAD